MNILFISYWGIQEGLTYSTVIPHIKILSRYDQIKKIILITIERERNTRLDDISVKIEHIPIYSKSYLIPFFSKIIDFIKLPALLKQHCIKYQIDKIVARGVLAGALAQKTSKKSGIPYYVESFEPHADYMIDTGTWRKWGLKYLMQKNWELKQLKSASGIMTVSQGYTDYLKKSISENIKVLTVPCAVDMNIFKFNEKNRFSIRKKFGIDEKQIVGIYVGKFGSLYLDVSELNFINALIKFFPDTGFIFLTPYPVDEIEEGIKLCGIIDHKLVIKKVPHSEVPLYLSSADYALSLNKIFPSGKYLSPVKIGEYWANGLPVLMTEGIGDERNFLETEKGGVLFNENNLMSSLKKLREILDDPDHRIRIPELARKYRSFDKVKEAYEKMIISPEE